MNFETFNKSYLKHYGQQNLTAFLNNLYKNYDLFYTKTVQELLWGYEDPLLKVLHDIGMADNSTFALAVRTMLRYVYWASIIIIPYSKTIVSMIVRDGLQSEQVS